MRPKWDTPINWYLHKVVILKNLSSQEVVRSRFQDSGESGSKKFRKTQWGLGKDEDIFARSLIRSLFYCQSLFSLVFTALHRLL